MFIFQGTAVQSMISPADSADLVMIVLAFAILEIGKIQ